MRTKKHLLLTLFAGLALVLASACSDDDDNGTNDAGTHDGTVSDTGSGSDTINQSDSVVTTQNYCVEKCTDTANCTIGTSSAAGYVCGDNERCVQPGCTDATECFGTYSGWNTSCEDDSGCTGMVCISDLGGVCALEKTGDCALGTAYDTKKKEDDSDVTVCANQDYTCTSAGTCGCANDDACTSLTATPKCNTDTGACMCDGDSCGDHMQCLASGQCGCADNDGCSATATTPTCNTDTGACMCTTDPADSCGDHMKCLDSGQCGCADDDGCSNGVCDTDSGMCVCNDAANDCKAAKVFDGTEYVCGTL